MSHRPSPDNLHVPLAQAPERGAEWGAAAGRTLGTAVEEAAVHAEALAAGLADSYDALRSRLATTDAGDVVRHWGEVVEGVVEEGRERAAAALATPTRPSRRWPWAVTAAVAGAVAGAAVALAVRRVVGEDAPGAQEPEQLRAVVDTDTPA